MDCQVQLFFRKKFEHLLPWFFVGCVLSLSHVQSLLRSFMLDVMDLLGRKGGAQGIEHGQYVDDFLHDGTAYRA